MALRIRYGFGSLEGKVERGEITREEKQKLEDAVRNGKPPDEEFLLHVFSPSTNYMKQIAKELGKDTIWDEAVIDNYFLGGLHNRHVETGVFGSMGKTQQELCKVHLGEIKEISQAGNKTFYKVAYNGGSQTVFADFVPDANQGDKVVIHQSYAVKMVNGSRAAEQPI